MQNVVDRARLPLNDAKTGTDDSACRWKDIDLLGYANAAIEKLRIERADLFFGGFETAYAAKLIGDPIPIDDEYMQAMADYATARAECGDDEAAVEERAVLFFNLFAATEGAKG